MSDYQQAMARALEITEKEVLRLFEESASASPEERVRMVGQMEGIERVLGYFDDELSVMDMENQL